MKSRQIQSLLFVTLLFLGALSMVSCDTEDVKKTTVAGWATELRTIDHDGHRWVVANTGHKDGGVAIIHHPDCACGKVK